MGNPWILSLGVALNYRKPMEATGAAGCRGRYGFQWGGAVPWS